jgi:hypothetical protein
MQSLWWTLIACWLNLRASILESIAHEYCYVCQLVLAFIFCYKGKLAPFFN